MIPSIAAPDEAPVTRAETPAQAEPTKPWRVLHLGTGLLQIVDHGEIGVRFGVDSAGADLGIWVERADIPALIAFLSNLSGDGQ